MNILVARFILGARAAVPLIHAVVLAVALSIATLSAALAVPSDVPPSAGRVSRAGEQGLTRRERDRLRRMAEERAERLKQQHHAWAFEFVPRFIGTWRFEIRSTGVGETQPYRTGRRTYSARPEDPLRLDWFEEYDAIERSFTGFFGFDADTGVFFDLGVNSADDRTGFVTGDFNASGTSVTFRDVKLVPSYELETDPSFRLILRFEGDDHIIWTMTKQVQVGFFISYWVIDAWREPTPVE